MPVEPTPATRYPAPGVRELLASTDEALSSAKVVARRHATFREGSRDHDPDFSASAARPSTTGSGTHRRKQRTARGHITRDSFTGSVVSPHSHSPLYCWGIGLKPRLLAGDGV